MKKLVLILIIAIGALSHSKAQNSLNAGIGMTVRSDGSKGAVLNMQFEKPLTENFSLPLSLDMGYTVSTDYNTFNIEISKGFKITFESGLFIEQSIGIGLMAHFYKVESIWYNNEQLYAGRYRDGANWGITPAVKAGIGYNLTRKKETQNLIWLRPKVYLNLGTQRLDIPFSAIQLGFTHQIKLK